MKIENHEQVNESIPVLKKIVEMTKDNSYMDEIYMAATRALENAERCVKFGIYTTSDILERGCGIYLMPRIPNIEEYDIKHPEELLKISFPTGPYTFNGRYYDQSLFEEFYNELLEVEPDYHDSKNYALYYKPQNAKRAWEHCKETYRKYILKSRKRCKELELEEAKREYEELLKAVEGDQE